jgi:hypothetical protein
MSWHAGAELIADYVSGALTPAHAASVEAHLMGCGHCRATVGDMSDDERLRRTWSAIEDQIDRSRTTALERVLVRVGVREHRARLVATTTTMHVSWLAAIVTVLGTAVLLDSVSEGSGVMFYGFLVVTPLLPLFGVAAAFHPSTDPAHELALSTPKSTFELVLVRALAVLMVTLLLSAAATFALPQDGWSTAAWLLPALGLTTATMALATYMPAYHAAGALTAVWVVGAVVSVRGTRIGDHVERFVAFRPSGQLACVAVTAVAVAVLCLRRTALEFRKVV